MMGVEPLFPCIDLFGGPSLGATSGLLWMMQLLDRKRSVAAPGLVIPRRWGWIAAGVAVTLVYAAVLGPTIRP